MRLKLYVVGLFVSLFACTACSAHAQAVHSATQKVIPLSIGAGLSGYNAGYGQGHLLGGTLWIDYTLKHVPYILHGIGIEAEGRDLNYGRSDTQPANQREDTALGGVIYSYPRYRDFRPYGKFMMGYGNTDNETLISHVRWHDSRTISAAGGGFEFRAHRNIWVRADYEYQFWPDIFKHTETTIPSGQLHPQGFTVGAMYHFGRPHYHE